jgi:HK97 family phage prohead protease
MAETYRPTKGMQEAATRALAWIKDGKAGQGFTDVGRKRASDIAAGRSMSAEIVMRMYSFFARHEVDKKAIGFSAGEDGYPSPGRVSWDAWGGDAGFSWSTKIKNQLDNNVRALQQMTSEEGAIMVDPTNPDLMMTEDPMQEETMGTDAVLHSVMAADAAMDAAQSLLADNLDPIVSQAYYLICAADAALSEVIEALGGMDEDDDMSEEDAQMPAMAMLGMYSAGKNAATELRISTGSFVSWNSSGGTAKGKVASIVTSGTAVSSDGYEMDANADKPVFKITLYKEGADGWEATDTTVLHLGETLTQINALRSKESELVEARKSVMEKAERITMTADIRSVATEDGTLKIGGYAATFNQEADGLNFREVIAPGAFTRTLQSDQPMFLLVNHDFESLPLASTQSGTLRLAEDSVGLRMEATLDPMNPRAAELASALSRGDVDKMSFAFTVADGGDTREGGLRTLTDLDLYEVSVVTMPAYSSTSVGMRKAEDDNLALRKRQLQLKFNQLRLRK